MVGAKVERLVKMIKTVIIIFLLILLGFFFSYKLLEVPPGLTVDEASFGYNAVLLADTLSDQNGRFLPFFVHAIEGKEWLQPVTQYFIALFFKVFGSSVFNLRFTSVLITLLSIALIYFLASSLAGKFFGLMTTLTFITTPLLMIQSHMALDNIMPIPFTLIWLLGLFLFQKTGDFKYLVLAGLSLGIGFYSYKGMRAIVPIWCLLTIAYIAFMLFAKKTNTQFRQFIKSSTTFLATVFPFFAIMPILDIQYPGAILGGATISLPSYYEFLYPYLSSFDPSFLFVKGDSTFYHSTGQHGMLLAASLPLFLIGCYQAVKQKRYWLFILLAFFTAPILYGLVGSVHRASRLTVLIPLYSLISALGAKYLWETRHFYKKLMLIVIVALMFFNFYDFVKYYWFTYPLFTQNLFGNLKNHESYNSLAKEAIVHRATPYISWDVYRSDGEHARFYEAIYFRKEISKWSNNDEIPPSGSILLSNREEVPGMERLKISLPAYHLHLNPK